MRTRTVLRWNVSPRDALELALFVSGCAALVVLDAACERLEAWVDAWGERL